LAANNKSLAANDKAPLSIIPYFTRPFERSCDSMIKTITDDLRAVAERCTRLARDCRRYELSRALQELGIELMAKASELESKFGE